MLCEEYVRLRKMQCDDARVVILERMYFWVGRLGLSSRLPLMDAGKLQGRKERVGPRPSEVNMLTAYGTHIA